MQRLILIFFIASELCYYLLIAQTGVVEYFSSNLFLALAFRDAMAWLTASMRSAFA